MFTGIVEQQGRVVSADTSDTGARFTIESRLITSDLEVGDSVAVNGTCLTAVTVDRDRFRFAVDLVPETLDRTSLGAITEGASVNLERAMPASGRFDGHVVQGHVDGVGIVATLTRDGEGVRMGIDLPPSLLRYVVDKGSITLDGVSLTVAAVGETGIEIALIPHTLEVTTLGSRATGDRINVEVDILAKYVERLMELRT